MLGKKKQEKQMKTQDYPRTSKNTQEYARTGTTKNIQGTSKKLRIELRCISFKKYNFKRDIMGYLLFFWGGGGPSETH